MRSRWRNPGVIAASLALLFCGGLAFVSGVRAIRISPLPESPPLPGRSTPSAAADGASSPATASFARAVARDPFHPERRASGERFSMPGSEAPPEQLEAREQERAGEVRLVGTAVVPGGRDFVMCQIDRERPTIVRVGERCGRMVLKAVQPQEARFTDANGTVVLLHVPKSRMSP